MSVYILSCKFFRRFNRRFTSRQITVSLRDLVDGSCDDDRQLVNDVLTDEMSGVPIDGSRVCGDEEHEDDDAEDAQRQKSKNEGIDSSDNLKELDLFRDVLACKAPT